MADRRFGGYNDTKIPIPPYPVLMSDTRQFMGLSTEKGVAYSDHSTNTTPSALTESFQGSPPSLASPLVSIRSL